MKALCLTTNCADPSCRLTHLVVCVFCGLELEEEEAVDSEGGVSCEACVIAREEDSVCN